MVGRALNASGGLLASVVSQLCVMTYCVQMRCLTCLCLCGVQSQAISLVKQLLSTPRLAQFSRKCASTYKGSEIDMKRMGSNASLSPPVARGCAIVEHQHFG